VLARLRDVVCKQVVQIGDRLHARQIYALKNIACVEVCDHVQAKAARTVGKEELIGVCVSGQGIIATTAVKEVKPGPARERVIASAPIQDVAAVSARQLVIAKITQQQVISRVAKQCVIATAPARGVVSATAKLSVLPGTAEQPVIAHIAAQ
jgi:hypothetical protein